MKAMQCRHARMNIVSVLGYQIDPLGNLEGFIVSFHIFLFFNYPPGGGVLSTSDFARNSMNQSHISGGFS